MWCTVHEPQASYEDEYAEVYCVHYFLLLSSLLNFVCFSFTLFLVVVAAFCADDADKSLPVKFGPMIFFYAVSKVAPILSSFPQHVPAFRSLNLKRTLLLENVSCICILSFCLEQANLNTLV